MIQGYNMCQTYSMERVVAATAELVTTLWTAEMHAASFRQRILKATVRTGWRERGKEEWQAGCEWWERRRGKSERRQRQLSVHVKLWSKFFFPQLYSVYRLFIYSINVLHPFDSCKKVTFKAGVIDWKLLWAKQVSGVDNSPGHHHLNTTCTASPHPLSVKGAGWETCRSWWLLWSLNYLK